jgi:lipopolysaccharide biosynthesis glycosyltransferase
MDQINIILSSDENYAPHLATAMVSVVANCSRPQDIYFHVLDCGLSELSLDKIKLIGANQGTRVAIYLLSANLLSGFPKSGHLSLAAYGRLFAGDILPKDINRAIYLDCDLVCLGDVADLYNCNISGKTLGAIRDVKSDDILRIYFYPGLKTYFNSGVLLIDMDRLRKFGLSIQATNFINIYRQHLATADQDVLNCLFEDDWQELPRCFNLDMKHESAFRLPPADTVILHYSDRIKPWSYLYFGRNNRYYLKYRLLSPWPRFSFTDRNFGNFFLRYFLAIKKGAANLGRPFLPKFLVDYNKRRFNRRVVRY